MWPRQVLRLTQKVRRENEPLKTVKLNFAATFCRKFSLRTPCWAHIWVVLHKNWYFLMANRIFIHHSKSNHCQSVNLQFGTQFGTWISHFGHMDFSNSCFEFLHSCTLQLSQVDLKWSCRLIDNLMGCIFEPAPYSHGEFVMYMPKIDFWLIFFWQKSKFLAGHCWKHCHTLDLCCLNSVHRMFDHRLIVFKVYFSHRHFRICFKWLFYN